MSTRRGVRLSVALIIHHSPFTSTHLDKHALRKDVRKIVKKGITFEIQHRTKTLRQCQQQLEYAERGITDECAYIDNNLRYHYTTSNSKASLAKLDQTSDNKDNDEEIRTKLAKSQHKLGNRIARLERSLVELKTSGAVDMLATAIFERGWTEQCAWMSEYELTRDFELGAADVVADVPAAASEDARDTSQADLPTESTTEPTLVQDIHASKHVRTPLDALFADFHQFVRILEKGREEKEALAAAKNAAAKPSANTASKRGDQQASASASKKAKRQPSIPEGGIFFDSLNAGSSDDGDSDDAADGFESDPNISGDDVVVEREVARRARFASAEAVSDTESLEIDDDEVERLLRNPGGKGSVSVAKPKKNRLGQQARRKQYEELYGQEANHVKKERERGAVAPRGGARGGRGGIARGGATRGAFAGRGGHTLRAQVPVARTQPAASTLAAAVPDNLHPSWIAKKQQQQRMAIAIDAKKTAGANKIVFGDDD